MVMKSAIFWDITPCSNVSPPSSESKSYACHLLSRGFLLGLLFDPEDGGDMFLRNVG
jgi:hypothetical protein